MSEARIKRERILLSKIEQRDKRIKELEQERITTIEELSFSDIVRWFDSTYPKDIFKTHPVSWFRKMLKWLNGADAMVMIQEAEYEHTQRKDEKCQRTERK